MKFITLFFTRATVFYSFSLFSNGSSELSPIGVHWNRVGSPIRSGMMFIHLRHLSFRGILSNFHIDVLWVARKCLGVSVLCYMPAVSVQQASGVSGCGIGGCVPPPTWHHSFFSASIGLVRAARRVCQRTEAMVTANEIRTQRM